MSYEVSKERADIAKERADIAKERADIVKERADIVKERADIDQERADLRDDIESMRSYKEKLQGHVRLNIGGYHYDTSVQTLRRLPATFFGSYFSGRYPQDVCTDGSIFVDRDGENFGHILEYMRDGNLSVAEPGARPSLSLLRALKREFGFYCIPIPIPAPSQSVIVVGGDADGSIEEFDASSEEWKVLDRTDTTLVRNVRGCAVIAGDVWLIGELYLRKYNPFTGIAGVASRLPEGRRGHTTTTIGTVIFIIGGKDHETDVLKFETTTGTWTRGCDVVDSETRSSVAVAVGTDIYLFGGDDAPLMREGWVQTFHATDNNFKYDTVGDVWTIADDVDDEVEYAQQMLPIPALNHSAILFNELVYIVGAGPGGRHALRFDPTVKRWAILKNMVKDMRGCATFVLDGSLYAAGGNVRPSEVVRYDSSDDTWSQVVEMSHARHFFHAAVVATLADEEKDVFDMLIFKETRRQW
jgi:hypothetical protein